MKTTEELVPAITDYINTYSDKSAEFNEAMEREHRTLQQSFTRLCLKWLEHVASENYQFDGRNEDSHKVAERLVEQYTSENQYGFRPSEMLRFI